MANTIIQIKRSTATAAPTTLNNAELAYSFNANKLFIGNSTSHVHTIGGAYYTSLVDAATDTNTASAIVKRDASGIFSATGMKGRLFGNANTATQFETKRYINLSGDVDAVSTLADGTANSDLVLELTDTGVAAAWYGSGSIVPVFQVDADGRIVAAANVASAASGSFGVDGDSGSAVVSSSETLEFIGGDGITTSVADVAPGANVTIDVDSTVVRTTGDQAIGGNKTFSSNVVFTADVVMSGSVFRANTITLEIGDNIIQLNRDLWGNVAPSENAGVDINRGSSANVSILWNETSDTWTLTEDGSTFRRIWHEGYSNASAITTGTIPSARVAGSYTGITGVGIITAGYWGGNIVLANTGGTGISSYAVGDILYASATDTLSKLADVAVGNVLISGGVGAAPSWGKVNLISHIVNVLNVASGGTGVSSFTNNGILYGQVAGPLAVTAAGTEGKVLQANASGVPFFGDLDGGTF